jgi:hypothetical protein
MVNKQGEANMATTPLLDKVIEIVLAIGASSGIEDRYDALKYIAAQTDKDLYGYAKLHNVLVHESAADFACEFYATFNDEIYYRY